MEMDTGNGVAKQIPIKQRQNKTTHATLNATHNATHNTTHATQLLMRGFYSIFLKGVGEDKDLVDKYFTMYMARQSYTRNTSQSWSE